MKRFFFISVLLSVSAWAWWLWQQLQHTESTLAQTQAALEDYQIKEANQKKAFAKMRENVGPPIPVKLSKKAKLRRAMMEARLKSWAKEQLGDDYESIEDLKVRMAKENGEELT